MDSRPKLDFDQLTAGYEFPPSHFKLDAATAAAYLKAVEDTSPFYRDTGLVPPMAIAALAMAALAEGMTLPPGAIHVSQEFDFIDAVTVGESLTSHAKVGAKQSRSKFRILSIDLNVLSGTRAVLIGKTSFILP